MPNTNPILEGRLGFPEDLREWIDDQALVRMVFEALYTVEDDPAKGPTPALRLGAPRIFLTILTYSYAIGLYSSEEIERRIVLEPDLEYLSAKTTPSGSDLRRFRRHNRAFIHQSVRTLLRLVWEKRLAMIESEQGEWGSTVDRDVSGSRIEWLCDSLAEQRINRAILADTMALDN